MIFGGLFSLGHLSSNLWVYSAGVSFAAAGMSLVWPALHSWLGAEPNPARRTRLMGAFSISWSMGLAVGPLIGGYLYVVDHRLPVVGVFVMSAGAAWLLYRLPAETVHEVNDDTPVLSMQERLRLERLIASTWVANGLGWALVIVTRMVFPKQMNDLVANGELRILFEEQAPALLTYGAARIYGILAFVLSFTSCVMYLTLGHTSWWHGRFSLLVTVQIAAAIAVWLLGATTSVVVMALCFAVIGANCGVCFFAASYYCTVNPEKKHRRLAINEGVVGMGGFAAPFGLGYFANEYGIEASFKYTPVLVLLLLLAQVALLVRARKNAAAAG
jgi:DHA1 family quinolone resistance protein-like MFS transporter